MTFEVGQRYPLTVQDYQSLINITGSRLTAILLGRPDLTRGRRLVKEPGDWELWNVEGKKITFHVNPSLGTAIAAVANEVDPDRPEPLQN